MFYSHTYLKRNGRFGLIWLAATQSKVLSKRELYAIDISMTCSDILSHIPGYIGKEVVQRPRRFSLYLTSQLMYGSAKVLQRQWEYLFLDVTALFRRFHPEITSDIDLIILKPDPVTIASCVPTSKDYDPFFGSFKEPTVDVEAILDVWDRNYVSKYLQDSSQQDIDRRPPATVADRMDIQIRDSHVYPIEAMLPGEQDLPLMDMDNLTLISDDVNLSMEELLSPQVSRILAATDITQTRVSVYGRSSLEETPAVRVAGEMPSTPQKPKRKRRHDVPEKRKTKRRAIEQEGLPSAAEEQEVAIDAPHMEYRPEAGVGLPHGHDWLQQQPIIQLSPVTPKPSPARRKRAHKLIIDQTIQMSREDMKHNMLTSDSTVQPWVLPSSPQTHLFKAPGSQSLKYPAFIKLWSRNCKFGLRVYDTGTESSPSAESPISPVPAAAARERVRLQMSEVGTPVQQALAVRSLPPSVERGRDVSAKSASLEGDQSHSLIAAVSDESQAVLSARKGKSSSESETSGREHLSLADLEQPEEMTVLHTWPEEQEQMISPIPLQPESDLRAEPGAVVEDAERQTATEPDSPRTQVLKLVTENLQTADDWTTFRAICPPTLYNKAQAARLFLALCCQVGQGNLCVRQDEAYHDIYIWLPAGRPQ